MSTSTEATGRRVSWFSRAGVTVVVPVVLLLDSACGGLPDPTPRSAEHPVVVSTVTTTPGEPLVQGGVGAPGGGHPSAPTGPWAPPGDAGELATRLPPGVALAVAPVGRPGELMVLGAWASGAAWSTIKVPLALAALRSGAAATAADALTTSDNDAAQAMWDALGGGTAASGAVTAVLREAGDPLTTVPSVRLRSEFTVFGQTEWSLADQTRFGSRFPCLVGSARILDLMGRVVPAQSWGLGRIPGARFKGGWGPSPTRGHLVRQLGIIPGAGGEIAVAIAVEADTVEQGTAALDTAVQAVGPRLTALPGGRC